MNNCIGKKKKTFLILISPKRNEMGHSLQFSVFFFKKCFAIFNRNTVRHLIDCSRMLIVEIDFLNALLDLLNYLFKIGQTNKFQEIFVRQDY